jgi:hypothetical protein
MIVDSGNAFIGSTIALDDSNNAYVVTGIVTVVETSALYDYGNGAVVTFIMAGDPCNGAVRQ